MKLKQIFRTLMFAAILGGVVTTFNSCKGGEDDEPATLGTIKGTVLNEDTNDPIEGVTVTVSGVSGTVQTGSDGTFTVEKVSVERHTLTLTKTGYQETSTSVAASKFDSEKVATVTVTMKEAGAKVLGRVLDGDNGNAPLAGVTVAIGSINTTTGSDGKFTIEDIAAASHTVTFTKTDYSTVTKNITLLDFDDKVADLGDIVMGGKEILPGQTIASLMAARKWYNNEYKGGRNANDAYPQFDWSVDYLCTLDHWGNYEEQNEGSTLRIRNDAAQQTNPANMDVFDSYMYGVKKITADNKILSVLVRTHNADAAAPAHFGVQVVDPSAAEPAAVKVGETQTHGDSNYEAYYFDLSDYVGKEVIIAVGIYRAQTGDYWKQLVLRRLAFAQDEIAGENWISGAAITGLENWNLTQEMVRSIMPQTLTSFTGLSPVSISRDNYYDGYRAWRDNGHIAANWTLMPLVKDPEVTPSEGYLIKTKSNADADTKVPQAYFFAKFAIAAGKNTMTLTTRNFSSEFPTFFKLTAIDMDMNVKYMDPTSNTANTASAAADGCWEFIHEAGGAGDPGAYATFTYNLSEFNGKEIVIALSVHNGAVTSNENKLVIYSIDFN